MQVCDQSCLMYKVYTSKPPFGSAFSSVLHQKIRLKIKCQRGLKGGGAETLSGEPQNISPKEWRKFLGWLKPSFFKKLPVCIQLTGFLGKK